MVNVVDLKKIKEYKEMFESEKKEFKNSSYSTFSNSYIKKSSDPYMQRMSSNLDKIYLNINSAYDTIKKWWDEYIENIEDVDKKIVNNSSLSKSIDKIKNDFLSSLKDSIISKDLEEMKNDFSKKFENFNKIAAENPELADAINTVMREHPEYDFESYCERCMNDPSFVDNVMTAADNINKQKAAEKYAEDHPIKSSKFVKGASKFFSGAKEIYFDAGENLFGMGLNLANGVETGFKNVEGFFNYVFYANGWLDAQDYIELEQDKKKNEWFDDDVVNDFINNDTSLNDTKYSKTVNSIVGSTGEHIFPLLTTIVGGPLGGLLGGAIDGVGRGSGDSFEHQKEAMNGIPTEIGTDIKNGTVTYLYEGNKIVVDSTGNIISSMKMDESEYNKMLAKYINKTDISKGALLQGTWNAATWAAGDLLSGAKIVAKPFLNSTIKIGIDASMGGAETPIQALIQSTYAQFYVDENGNKVYYDKDASFGDKFEHAFSEKGGWKSVAEGAAMAAAMSTVGEAGDLSKKMKTQKEYRTMIDENPNAAAKKLTEFGFSEQEAVNALNKYSTKELAEKAAMLEEFSLSNNKKAFDSEFNKMKESINDNNLNIKSNKVEKSSEKFKENAKNIMNDNSGKFNIDAFKENFKGKSDKVNIDIDGIRRDYNIILNSEAEIDINIKNAIDYTLRKNGITPTKELIDRYYLEVQKGNYSVITRDRGWRQNVDDAINYKNNIQSQKIEYKKILDQSFYDILESRKRGISFEQYAADNGIIIKDLKTELDVAVEMGDANWYLVNIIKNNENKMTMQQKQIAYSATNKARADLDYAELVNVAGPFLTQHDVYLLNEISKHPNMPNISQQNANTLFQFQDAGGCEISQIARGKNVSNLTLEQIEYAMNGDRPGYRNQRVGKNLGHGRAISKNYTILDEMDEIIRKNSNTVTLKGVGYYKSVGSNVPTDYVLNCINQYGINSPNTLNALRNLVGLDMTDKGFNSRTIPPTKSTNYSNRFNNVNGDLKIKVESYISPGCGAYIDTYGGKIGGLGEITIKRNCPQTIIDAYVDPSTNKLVLVTLYHD